MSDTTFQEIPLAQLRESTQNPRRHFDPKKLEELTVSIKANGIRTPLLVRSLPSSFWRSPTEPVFEIGAGHRRYRAAKLAGVDVVPAIVRPMTDPEFLELLNFENLEREDIHPLEEAQGYRILMAQAGHDVESIAARVGKSVKYVYDRVKLLALTKPAQKLFLDNRMTAGHAILLARLTPADQASAIDPEKAGGGYHHALFEPEGGLFDEMDEIEEQRKKDPWARLKPVSVREFEQWIAEHVRFDKKAADPMLFPETVAIVAQAVEEKEKIVQITHEHHVQPEARDEKERIYGPRSWKEATKPCEKAVTGVVVVGPDRGKAFKVCLNKECKFHWAAEMRERAKRAASPSSASAQDRYRREEERRQADEAKAQAERQRWKLAEPKILEAIAATVKRAPAGAKSGLAGLLIDRIDRPIEGYLTRGTSAEDLVRYVGFQILAEDLDDHWRLDQFVKLVRGFGVDVRKIVAAAVPKIKPAKDEGKKKAAAKT